jgi:2-aminoadipate transaminase
MIDWFKDRYSVNVSDMKRSEIRELLKLTRRPEIISFAGGLPSPETFPVEEIAELSRDLILREGHWALQYGPTEGDARLKEQIIRFMAKDGMKLEPENLLIVSASQQALDMTARLFLNRGDAVMLGRPSYVGAIGAFRACGARFVGIDLDEQGMRTDLVRLNACAGPGIRPNSSMKCPIFRIRPESP